MKREFAIDVTWYGYELRPEMPAQGVALTRRFPPEQLQKIYENLRRMGAPFGIVFGNVTVTPNTHLALSAAEYARDAGRFDSFHERVFRAYFTDCSDIGSLDVVLGLAESEGLDPDDLKKALQTDRYAARLKEARDEAEAYKVSAVPTFIIGGIHKIVGAQSIDSFRKLLISASASKG